MNTEPSYFLDQDLANYFGSLRIRTSTQKIPLKFVNLSLKGFLMVVKMPNYKVLAPADAKKFGSECFGSTYIRMQNRIQIGLQSDLDPIPKIEQKKTPNIISTNKDLKMLWQISRN